MRQQQASELRAERAFPATVTSASAARRFVDSVLAGWGCESLRDDALLLVSELVTNAATHADSACQVVLRHLPDRLRVEVHDGDARHQPVPQPYDVTAQHGRGLLIVDRVAARWGTDHRGDGKVVWFELVPS